MLEVIMVRRVYAIADIEQQHVVITKSTTKKDIIGRGSTQTERPMKWRWAQHFRHRDEIEQMDCRQAVAHAEGRIALSMFCVPNKMYVSEFIVAVGTLLGFRSRLTVVIDFGPRPLVVRLHFAFGAPSLPATRSPAQCNICIIHAPSIRTMAMTFEVAAWTQYRVRVHDILLRFFLQPSNFISFLCISSTWRCTIAINSYSQQKEWYMNMRHRDECRKRK